MTSPQDDIGREQAAGRSWARQAARASMVAPFAAMLVQVLGQQLAAKREESFVEGLYFWCSALAMLLLVAGFAGGCAGFVDGRRQRSLDTQLIALMGMAISGGLVALVIGGMLWTWWK